MEIMLTIIGVCFALFCVGLLIWDQSRIRGMRQTLTYDDETETYSWIDVSGWPRTSKVDPSKPHTNDERGGEWGDGLGPDPQS